MLILVYAILIVIPITMAAVRVRCLGGMCKAAHDLLRSNLGTPLAIIVGGEQWSDEMIGARFFFGTTNSAVWVAIKDDSKVSFHAWGIPTTY